MLYVQKSVGVHPVAPGLSARDAVVETRGMASYSVNKRAVAKAKALIDTRQYVLDSRWTDAQPSADDENTYLNAHSWDEYAEWHLGPLKVPATRRRRGTRSCTATFVVSIEPV
jgi:hypothetical protein